MTHPHRDARSALSSKTLRRSAGQPPASPAEPASFQSDGKTATKAAEHEPREHGGIDFTLEGGEMAAASRQAMLTAVRLWEQALEPVQALQTSMMRWNEQFWREAAGGARAPQMSRLLTPASLLSLPSADVKETAEAFIVSVELPGLTEQDVSVSIDHDQVKLQGHKAREQERETSTYRRSERWFGAFERTFPLPEGVAHDRITRSMRNGVLEIVLPKATSQTAPPQATVRH